MSQEELAELEANKMYMIVGLILVLAFFVFVYYAGVDRGELNIYSYPKMQKCI